MRSLSLLRALWQALNAASAASEPKQSKRSIPETPLPSTARCRPPHAGGQPSEMGSLQRSSSLGRAGESSLQTAARKYLEREQKLKNSPYGRPLLKSRSDPAAIRKQRYSTSSSEIGSGVARQQQSKAKKHRQRMEDEAFARQLLVREGLEEARQHGGVHEQRQQELVRLRVRVRVRVRARVRVRG